MKPYLNIPRTKERQPKYPEPYTKIYIMLNTDFLWFYGVNNGKKILIQYTKPMLAGVLEAIEVNNENKIQRFSNSQFVEHYIEKRKKIAYIRDNIDLCLEGLNRMIRNHVRKHNMYDYEIEELDRDTLKYMLYGDYLKTEHWDNIKNCVRRQYSNTCMVCGSADKVHFHHRSYKNRGDIVKEVFDVCVLCEVCHTWIHKNEDINKRIKYNMY